MHMYISGEQIKECHIVPSKAVWVSEELEAPFTAPQFLAVAELLRKWREIPVRPLEVL